ncbi:MAG: NADPH:quinone oxidoreductase family protein [Burkholderiales bacterium]|jgi:NADPH2:quinone reductase
MNTTQHQQVQADQLGDLSAYQLKTVTTPEPAHDEVLIEVGACGIGYVDALIALGRYQVRPAPPHTPGSEIAGRVRAVGRSVHGLSVGDRVLGTAQGGFAELACAAASTVFRIPDALSLEAASGLVLNYRTALHALRDRARLSPEQQVLVLGAAGGTGVAAIQVARALGARVIACASTEDKRRFALEQGAHAVIDTQTEGWRDRLTQTCGGRGPDVVFDPVCGPLFEPAFRSLHWRGTHLVIGFVGGAIPALKANLPLLKGAALMGVDVRQYVLKEPAAARQDVVDLLEWAAQGIIRPPVGRSYALADFREALDYAFSGQGLGKTVLRIPG